MELYNALIRELDPLLDGLPAKRWAYKQVNTMFDRKKVDLVF